MMKLNQLSGIAAISTLAALATAAPADAFSFGNSGIQFDTDTTVEFKFVESHGAYQSALKVFERSNLNQSVANLFHEVKQSDNGGSKEWLGTFGNAVTSSNVVNGNAVNSVTFTFKAGVDYVLGLVTGNKVVYSTNALNSASGQSQQAVFGAKTPLWNSLNRESTNTFQQAGNYTQGNPFAGAVLISFDDRGNANDKDFQDFAVQAQAVPEPMTMAGIALAGAGMAAARRRQKA
jgi:hypothetical protein